MTSYKPKKKNESVLKKTILEILRKKWNFVLNTKKV
jgi:hypothetical protein